MSSVQLPPCGLYRTLAPIGSIPAGRLVYFHNHGDPGPGLYLPDSWRSNRARFSSQGLTLTDPSEARLLEPLAPEGFYAVTSSFYCCPKQCRVFSPDALVQLGYNAAGEPLLFEPEIQNGDFGIPDRGTRIEPADIAKLRRLRLVEGAAPSDAMVH